MDMTLDDLRIKTLLPVDEQTRRWVMSLEHREASRPYLRAVSAGDRSPLGVMQQPRRQPSVSPPTSAFSPKIYGEKPVPI